MAELYRVDVAAGPETAGYPVVFTDELAQALARMVADRPVAAVALIADATVAGLYAERVVRALELAVGRVLLLTFPPGGASKTRARWAELTDGILQAGVGRDTAVVALGGGVTCDLAGFVAATCMRGLPLIQAPTSLLAMLDASVGGKTGVDTAEGKNLVGAFHAPEAVVIDPAVLETLPRPAVLDGAVEAVKHGAIADADYLDFVERHMTTLPDDAAATLELVRRSVEIKARVVERDPLERAERAVLNFGHTIGHGIERAADFRVGHGAAVAAGMELEARLGEALGVTEAGTHRRLRHALERLELPVASVPVERVLRAIRHDKKNRDGRVRTVLLERVGRVARASDGGWTHAVSDGDLERVLAVGGEAKPV